MSTTRNGNPVSAIPNLPQPGPVDRADRHPCHLILVGTSVVCVL